MSIPDHRLVVQINWTDVEGYTAWDQPYADWVGANLISVDVQRAAFHKSVRGETCTVEIADPGYLIRPLKASSPLWPNVRLHRRIRVLKRVSPGVFKAVFFGYLTNIKPDPVAISPPRVTLTAESPLAVLARRKVEVDEFNNTPVWVGESSNTGHGILARVMEQTGLIGTNTLQFENVGNQRIIGTWGGGTSEVGTLLEQMVGATGCVVSCEPIVQSAPGELNFVLKWYLPLGNEAPTVTWHNIDRTLEATSTLTIDYNDTREA